MKLLLSPTFLYLVKLVYVLRMIRDKRIHSWPSSWCKPESWPWPAQVRLTCLVTNFSVVSVRETVLRLCVAAGSSLSSFRVELLRLWRDVFVGFPCRLVLEHDNLSSACPYLRFSQAPLQRDIWPGLIVETRRSRACSSPGQVERCSSFFLPLRSNEDLMKIMFLKHFSRDAFRKYVFQTFCF